MRIPWVIHGLPAFALVLPLCFAGCATFRPLPLDSGAAPARIADLHVDAASMPTAALRAHAFGPEHGLDVADVAMLAIANNPSLKVQRDALGTAHAQAYAAGLLPDPQVSYAKDLSYAGQPGTTNALTRSVAFDLGNLVTRSARVAAARAGERQVNLELLWAEWQTIAQARTLFDRVYFARELVTRLQLEQAELAPLHAAVRHALDAGNLTYAGASAGLDAASGAAAALAEAQRQLLLAEHDLHDLLGLPADVPLHLTGAPFTVDPTESDVQQALTAMPQRRPDLLALQAGYESQQQQLRAAILAQFPAITVGVDRARDNTDVRSHGFSIGLALPLFDGNRGNIAIARTTRQQLRDAYDARLLTDRNDVRRLAAELASERAERATLAAHAAQLARARDAAATSYASGQLDWPTWLAIRASSLTADTALIALDQNLHAAAIALAALAGPWPTPAPAAAHRH